MKKHTAKLFGLTLAAALALTTLTGCNTAANTAPDSTSSVSALSASAGVGTVLLSVNPEIEMEYDQAGNVVSLTGKNDDGKAVLASYTDYAGKPCTTVVSELVNRINNGGYFDATIDGHKKNIILKLERGSKAPNDQFLNDLAAAVRTTVESGSIGSQTVALDDDDYDNIYGDRGYINAAAAQSLLSAQLGRNDIQFVEKDYDLDDGEYEIEFILDGVKYEYEVNAATGKITEMDTDTPHDDADDLDDDQNDDIDDDLYDDDIHDDIDDQYDDIDDNDDRYDDVHDDLDDIHDDIDDQYDDIDDNDDDWHDIHDDDNDDDDGDD